MSPRRRSTWLGPLLASMWALACGSPGSAEPCDGRCGPGTVCDGEVCVPEAPATEAATGEPPSNERKKRKRRRRRSKRADDTAEDASGADFVPPDDRHVPAYRDDRGQVIDENSGSERLSDRAVRRHMRTLEPAFNRCIEKAAMASDEDLGSGTVSFRINVDPDGKVAGVSVDAPKNLRVFGIVPCMRIAVHRSRFPTWNGPPMRVEYSFRVE